MRILRAFVLIVGLLLVSPSAAVRGQTPIGAEFRVNTITVSDQEQVAIAAAEGGGFVVAWSSLGQDGSSWGVFAQRFDSAGAASGGAFQVNAHTSLAQDRPAVAMDDDGDFVSLADGDALDFDAFDVDPATVGFGPLGAAAQGQPHAKDVDRDGDIDMTLEFHLRGTGIACGATTASLSGETLDGTAFEGTDSVLTHVGRDPSAC